MDWKNLIAFADRSDAGIARVNTALELARLSAAHLEVRYLYQPPRVPFGFELPAMDPAFDRLVKAAHADAANAAQVISALSKPGPQFSVHAESTGDASLSHGAALGVFGVDLAICALPERDPRELEILHGALFAGGGPCLVLPRWIEPHVWGKRVLIAWKSTPQAARALRAALPLLARAETVRLLLVDPRGARYGEDVAGLDRIAARLLRWNVGLESHLMINSSLGATGRAIEEEAEGFGADLVVMGAYGHARVSEWTMGGATQHMLQHARTPLIMAH